MDNTIFSFRFKETFIYFFIALIIADFIYYKLVSHEKPHDISADDITSFYDNYTNSDYERDAYFVDAAKFAIEKKKISIGMLQRMFKIGFNRAARIMDQLYVAGIIGPEDGTKPRKVLMSINQFEQFLASVEFITPLSAPSNDRIQMYNWKYDYMEGHDFEQFCAQLLEANGFSSVNVTPGSNDQGIDILAEKQGVKYAIQCKRYSSDVGNKAVQEVFAGKSYYNCHVGVVLTNRYFTQSAKELAKKTQVLLWNRDDLNSLCENYYKKEYLDSN